MTLPLAALVLLFLMGGMLSCVIPAAPDRWPPATRPPAAGATAPAGALPTLPPCLPRHFSLGLANRPEDIQWMIDSGIPWDFRYQYLAGGVNTGEGWATWTEPPGSFAASYVRWSYSHGYMPVFTYYMLVHSRPGPGDEDPHPKLQDPSLMKDYFSDWKLLLQQVGQSGKTVVVQHEPDLWGYIQRNGQDPAETFVAVESSGFEEVAGFEDNARGFARALAALRDRYAPRALLAWSASHWSTGEDLVINNGDPVAIGEKTAAFLKSLDAGFDLIFLSPADRDAAYYQLVHRDRGAHWWDDQDFATYREYIRTLTAATGLPAMLWQVPIGNTLYRSSDNTRGHYQDRFVQYFLSESSEQHLREYMAAGVIGILFGRGAGGQSNYLDSAGDGVTNPPPINGNDLLAEFPDDDGGFLRLSARAYYSKGPLALPLPQAPAGGC